MRMNWSRRILKGLLRKTIQADRWHTECPSLLSQSRLPRFSWRYSIWRIERRAFCSSVAKSRQLENAETRRERRRRFVTLANNTPQTNDIENAYQYMHEITLRRQKAVVTYPHVNVYSIYLKNNHRCITHPWVNSVGQKL